MRCLSLGQMLKDKGHNVYYATKTRNEKLLLRLRMENFEVIELNENLNPAEDVNALIQTGKRIDSKWIITDGYNFSTDYQKAIKENGFELLTIDDIADFYFVSDIVLNQNLNAENIFNYSCEPYTKLLLGVDYVLLRREYRNLGNYDRIVKRECENILITFGGSNAEKHIENILETFNLIEGTYLHLRILFDMVTENRRILDLVSGSKHRIELLQSQENIIPLIQWCDIAVSASGSTVWELSVLKTPAVIVPIADNQIPIAEELDKRDSALVLKDTNDIKENSNKISSLIKDFERIKKYSINISGLINLSRNNVIDYLC